MKEAARPQWQSKYGDPEDRAAELREEARTRLGVSESMIALARERLAAPLERIREGKCSPG